jgi:hypothetical protein
MPAGITRANRTVLDSQGAFVAGNTRRTVRRTPTSCFGPGRRDSGPSGREPPGGRLEPWWCTPTTSGSRASRGRSRRQRRPRSCRERRALRAVCRVTEARAGSAARTSPPKVAGRQQPADRNSCVRSWPSGLPRARGGRSAGELASGRSAWRPRRRGSNRVRFRSAAPKGGTKGAARGPKRPTRRWSPGHSTVRWDGPRVIRGETTRAELCRCGASRVRHPRRSPSGVRRWWQPAGRSFSSESGLRATRRRAGTAGG